MKDKKYNLEVKGDGSSLWSKSNQTFHVERFELFGEGGLYVYGKDLPWVAYTDNAIEQQINEAAKNLFPEISAVCWSEQGLQRDGCWHFDVSFK